MDMHPSYCGLHFESNLVHGLDHVRIYLQLEFFVFKRLETSFMLVNYPSNMYYSV